MFLIRTFSCCGWGAWWSHLRLQIRCFLQEACTVGLFEAPTLSQGASCTWGTLEYLDLFYEVQKDDPLQFCLCPKVYASADRHCIHTRFDLVWGFQVHLRSVFLRPGCRNSNTFRHFKKDPIFEAFCEMLHSVFNLLRRRSRRILGLVPNLLIQIASIATSQKQECSQFF